MGRSISGQTGGGAGSGVAMGYTPSRLYGAHGAAGGNNVLSVTSLVISPFLLRPGLHQVAGLWMALRAAGGCRLGLWADNGSGRPGVLLKDCGRIDNAPAGILKANFTSFAVDGGPTGRLIHFGATFDNAGPVLCRPGTGGASVNAVVLADLGLPQDLTATYIDGLLMDVSLAKAAVPIGDPLTTSPAVAATSLGTLVGGLIFG